MSVRIQVILDEAERDLIRRAAQDEGLSLSAWLRAAGRDRALATLERGRFTSPQKLEMFFAACDARERGEEPDWEDHLRVMGRSRAEGIGAPT